MPQATVIPDLSAAVTNYAYEAGYYCRLTLADAIREKFMKRYAYKAADHKSHAHPELPIISQDSLSPGSCLPVGYRFCLLQCCHTPGEMGIANTTPATALYAVLLDVPVESITGRGTGIDDDNDSFHVPITIISMIPTGGVHR